MKFNKNICIITGFFIFLINSISAQIRYDEYIGIIPFDDDLDIYLKNPCYFNCGEDIADFSFNWSNSFDTAVKNEILLKRARDEAKRDWFNKQKNLIKENIESKLGNKFANYNEAKDALFLSSESENITKNAKPLINKYRTLRSNGYNISRGYLKELKLLQLRKAEIDAGNINNSKYGYLKANNILLKDIKDIETLNQKWDNIVIPLGSNISKSHYNNSIYQKLNNLGTSFNEEIIALKNNYYNSFDEWKQLNLMQVLLNFIEYKRLTSCGVCLLPESFYQFKDIDKATSPVIEDYAIKNRNKTPSIFENTNIYTIANKILDEQGAATYIEAYDLAMVIINRQRIIINNLVNDVNSDDFVIENLLEGARTNILNNNNLTEAEKLIEFRKLYDTYDPLLTNSSTQVDYNAKIRSYITYFKRRGNHEFANYLETLLSLDNSFSKEDYIKLYETIREQKLNYFYALLKEIGLATFDAFKPVIEMALWEVGGGVALKVLSKLPIKYLTTPIKNVITRLQATTSTAFSNLKHAKKYGIQSYKQLAKEFEQLGLKLSKEGVERHHLIEVRFFKENPNIRAQLQNKFGANTDDWLCIIVEKTNKLTQSEHYILSQKWLKAIGRKGQSPGTTGFNSDNVPFDVIIEQARKIYKDYPEILNALGI